MYIHVPFTISNFSFPESYKSQNEDNLDLLNLIQVSFCFASRKWEKIFPFREIGATYIVYARREILVLHLTWEILTHFSELFMQVRGYIFDTDKLGNKAHIYGLELRIPYWEPWKLARFKWSNEQCNNDCTPRW